MTCQFFKTIPCWLPLSFCIRALYHLCIWQLFTFSSDFYILRKSCNCYFTAENIMKKNVFLLCAILSENTPGERFVNVVNYYWTFEANWLLRAHFSCKATVLLASDKNQSDPSNSTSTSSQMQLVLFTAPLKIKILFLGLFGWLVGQQYLTNQTLKVGEKNNIFFFHSDCF